ncbi:MAG: hypothetical protein FJ088_17125, partial [Deltaproteobacteria bacterium]|nr:hypothetical protein [Deltaproteobacteria bacterium]
MLHLVRKFLGLERQCVILAESADKAFQYRDEIEFYLRGFSASNIRVKLFNGDAFYPYRDGDFENSRGEEANLLFSLSGESRETAFLILTPDIFLRKFGHPVQKKEQSLRISVFDELDVSFLAEILSETGYRRCDIASEQGEFAIRGGIIDIFF